MPTEAPKTPEKKEKPKTPEETVNKNSKSSDKLKRKLEGIQGNGEKKQEKIESRKKEKEEKLEAKTEKKYEKLQDKLFLKTDKAYRGNVADYSDKQIQDARAARENADAIRAKRAEQKK